MFIINYKPNFITECSQLTPNPSLTPMAVTSSRTQVSCPPLPVKNVKMSVKTVNAAAKVWVISFKFVHPGESCAFRISTPLPQHH